MKIMITRKECLKALEVVEAYHEQLNLSVVINNVAFNYLPSSETRTL